MPRQMKNRAIPDITELAEKIYEENYKDAYASKVKLFPHIEGLLKDLAKCEAELHALSIKDAKEQAAGRDVITMTASNGQICIHPFRKIEKQWRTEMHKIIKQLNLSLEKKKAMKSERDRGISDLAKDL